MDEKKNEINHFMENKRLLFELIQKEIKDRQSLEWKIVAGVSAIFFAIMGSVASNGFDKTDEKTFLIISVLIFVIDIGTALILIKNQGIAHQNETARLCLNKELEIFKMDWYEKVFNCKLKTTWCEKLWGTGLFLLWLWFLSGVILFFCMGRVNDVWFWSEIISISLFNIIFIIFRPFDKWHLKQHIKIIDVLRGRIFEKTDSPQIFKDIDDIKYIEGYIASKKI